MENDKVFTLTNSCKLSFFNYHWRFLLTDHQYRKDFFVGRIEKDVEPLVLLGEELYDIVLQYESTVFGFQFDNQKFSSFGVNRK
jgi:hypothetical protein